ncbi:uncharacterized protein LOC129941006 [Eupeodes corollae]|uniref:uncharacterized protein LOC129941006 n=1 Tax=Eupeodes corollae TaxID=290404 RepID=UPI002492AF97|nr:uncharacterized protein LOC129941006 [Eupeodes corollae]
MDFYEMALICAFELKRRNKPAIKRQYWVHPLNSQRLVKGQFQKIYLDLRSHPSKFFNYFRMSNRSFDELLFLIRNLITFKNTRWRKAISPEERLAVTLRYLATGNCFRSLHYEFLIGETTLREIIKDTCDKIWICLKENYMPEQTEDTWKKVADKFLTSTNFPNCVGAIDGKHIRVQKPSKSGSKYMNYKNYFSLVLMAVTDADYCFLSVDIGSQGSASDSHVFQRSNFGKKLNNAQLNLPPDQLLPNDKGGKCMPFVFVADEAFALSDHIQRPFGRRNLSTDKKIYNYRLTRARRMVECSFGILSNKWRILHRPLDVHLSFCDNIIKACCILHNFVRKRDGIRYEDTLYECSLTKPNITNVRGSHDGSTARDYFVKYFNSPQGSVPWQYEKI